MKNASYLLLTLSIVFVVAKVYALDLNDRVAESEDRMIFNTLSNGDTAPAVKDVAIGKHQSSKLTFDFNNNNAVLNNKGEWRISGYVRHSKLLCANYQIAMRFGKAKNQCTNVTWIGDYQNGGIVKQCNNATVNHTATGVNPDLENNLDGISCAQIRITCTGACK